MNKNDGQRAFPCGLHGGEPHGDCCGMTLRDYFAGQWLTTFEIVGEKGPMTPEVVADRCYILADAMLAAREKP